jgi:hypothetical protein
MNGISNCEAESESAFLDKLKEEKEISNSLFFLSVLGCRRHPAT